MEPSEKVEKKKRGAPPGRIMTEAQREGLKKGFEALKAKREAVKAEKLKKGLGDVITKDLPKELPTATISKPLPEKKLEEKTKRIRPAHITKDDLIYLKNDIAVIIQETQAKAEDAKEKRRQAKQSQKPHEPGQPPHETKQPPNETQPQQQQPQQPQPQQQQPQQPIVISGHQLLNKIFFNR